MRVQPGGPITTIKGQSETLSRQKARSTLMHTAIPIRFVQISRKKAIPLPAKSSRVTFLSCYWRCPGTANEGSRSVQHKYLHDSRPEVPFFHSWTHEPSAATLRHHIFDRFIEIEIHRSEPAHLPPWLHVLRNDQPTNRTKLSILTLLFYSSSSRSI